MIKADNRQATIMYSQTYSLYADAVNDTYQISVWLPPDYETDDVPRPVLYVLDAPEFFGFVTSVVLLHLLDDALPSMIVVGIGKDLDTLDNWWELRWRDYSPTSVEAHPGSGQASLFFDLLSTEIMPFIDASYRTNPDDRAIYGHSLSGMFSLYALQRNPGLFRRYIATSPAFVVDNMTLMPYDRGLDTELDVQGIKLYLAVSPTEAEFKPYVDIFAQSVTERAYPGLSFSYDILEPIEHTPASTIAFIKGLRTVFS